MSTLTFSKGNAKLDKKIYIFSLPAGWSCPGAHECKSKAVVTKDGVRIKDGPNTKFRCYAASQEVLFSKTYEARQRNFAALRGKRKGRLIEIIQSSLPKKAKTVRLHASGDFYSQTYFDAWMEIAKRNPSTIFYAYTKSLPFWVKRKDIIPDNLVLTASFGGKHDGLIDKHNLRYAKVVFSEAEAQALSLEIDHDDSHAMKPGKSFALLLHGVQPKGSPAASALSKLRKTGKGGYSKKKKLTTV